MVVTHHYHSMNSMAVRRTFGLFTKTLSQPRPYITTSRSATVPFLRAATPRYAAPLQARVAQAPAAVRYNSSLTVPDSENNTAHTPPPAPAYQLTFTCKPCGHRSSHTVSKQGYHHGTVLIKCPSCENRHVISDHLKIFMDEKSTLEDILKRSAGDGDLSKLLKKGRLGMRDGHLVGNEGEEDIEFWEDGSETKHASDSADNK